ncbi:MAG: response regulator [Pelatocladus maniniholoensis HA4357-MV3]|jgi:chemotaxis protein histidine kinase CheA/ActR/RegA family two-component response regulator|uniref:histidine kinase n=1 Tax=Pelatocladus maniniholoensis HA4357-MV3 TaxID=1117104 RepID=A0A9E3H7G2_9NOST|nr:response regulator [Pelatocladus maniniholoensis HA4357-MV3]BAZ66365.1 multi-sensor signal transduction histidine kinase [Fischerella sp. NIES-4106]
MLPEQQQRILGYFIEEAKEHLTTIEQGLLNLQSTIKDPEMLNEVFRAAHSIKGGAAMLGLSSIQHTAHRLEDCFKVLKECPVKVDQKLESLFLGVSDTLKALLENLTGPFGLTEEIADHIMSEAEPVFGWLNEHLDLLVKQGATGLPLADTDRWQQRQNLVLQNLREMLQLFKQPATPETRQSLQECCRQLVELGKQLDCASWCNLCQAASQAIANQENSYLTLAKIVITEIKQALELVLAGREAEITISQQLEALLPPQIELLDITNDVTKEEADIEVAPSTALEETLLTIPVENTTADNNTSSINNITELITPSDSIEFAQADRITNLLDLSEQLDSNINNLVELTTQTELIEFAQADRITNLSDLSEQLHGHTDNVADLINQYQSQELELENTIISLSGVSNQFHLDDENEDLELQNLEINGPEVGLAELNTLAQLFESDTSDFNETWDIEEEISEQDSTKNQIEVEISDPRDTINDLAELLSVEGNIGIPDRQIINFKEELTLVQLFGDEFLEEESLDSSLKSPINEKIKSQQLQSKNETDEIKTYQQLQSNSDDLFAESENPTSIQEITQLIEENSTIDSLFDEEQQDHSPTIGINGSEYDDLFDQLSVTNTEFSSTTDDLVSSTQTEISGLGELEFSAEEDAAKALEEILFAAAADDDIFSDRQQQKSESVKDFELEDLDLSFPQDLILSTDTNDDFFAELTGHDSTITSPVDEALSPRNLRNISQQPEALEFTPEFTHFSTEIQAFDLHQPITEQELNWLDALRIEENSNETLEVLFNDLPVPDSHELQVDSKNNPFAFQPNSDDDALFTTDVADINFADMIASQTQADSEIDFLDKLIAGNQEVIAEYFNLDWSENILLSNLQKEELQPEYEQHNFQLEITDTELNLQDSSYENEIKIANLIEETSEIVETELESDAFAENAFTELGELLNEEAPLKAYTSAIPDLEFAALEEILTLEENEDAVVAEQSTPRFSKKDASNPILSPEIENEFKELEGMVGGAGTLSTVNLTGGRNSGWNTTSRFEQLMKVPVKHLDDLSNLVGELVVNRNTLEQDQERLRQSLDNLLHQVQYLSDVGTRMQELYERSLLEASLLASRKNSNFGTSDTDRGFSELEMDRFTPFHTLSQEMIELIVRVRESASDIDFVTEESERVARQFRQVTGQLQEGLTRARMEPFSQATDLLPRGVRDNSIKYGKQVELVIQGRDTLIDKMILEHLKTPLTHLLNNAIAHGIETPEQRRSQGKSPVGTITVCAFHQGNQTIISVSDDGAGINSDAVKAKAIKVGLITPTQAKTMPPIEVYDLLFRPGFSTKDQADDLAGRGVGLDVVYTKISEIRGGVSVDSAIGKGTSFTIRLPLTLSICKALFCVSDKARIAFPMDGVEDTLDVPVKNIQAGGAGEKLIPWRDRMLPFKPLKELLTFNRLLSRGNVYGGNRDDDMISVVVVRSANTLVALQVDQVLSEQEIVIKQFEGPAPKPVGVAGATVLGDGRIMPIADVLEIIDIFQGRASKQSTVGILSQKSTQNQPDTSVTKIDPTVLIVDDSITVRELLSLTFNKAGYRVEQARDGQEAWDKLRSGLPCDLVFCDIEMPRCDGLELLSRIQKDSNLNHLPIAMLTSRGADKHRQMAISLGASGYFTKPYLEEALLEAASRMLKGEKLLSS